MPTNSKNNAMIAGALLAISSALMLFYYFVLCRFDFSWLFDLRRDLVKTQLPFLLLMLFCFVFHETKAGTPIFLISVGMLAIFYFFDAISTLRVTIHTLFNYPNFQMIFQFLLSLAVTVSTLALCLMALLSRVQFNKTIATLQFPVMIVALFIRIVKVAVANHFRIFNISFIAQVFFCIAFVGAWYFLSAYETARNKEANTPITANFM